MTGLKFHRFREGQLIECGPEEFESWLRAIARRYEIRSDSDAAVIGLASQAVSDLIAWIRVNDRQPRNITIAEPFAADGRTDPAP